MGICVGLTQVEVKSWEKTGQGSEHSGRELPTKNYQKVRLFLPPWLFSQRCYEHWRKCVYKM